MFVNELILDGQWNHNLIQSLFCPSSIRRILAIPLPLSLVADRWIWKHCRDGCYSTSSGYRLSFNLKNPPSSEIFAPNLLDSSLWAKLWSLPIQPKLRFFAWNVFLDILPTSSALQTRHMVLSPLCPVCLVEEESITHLLSSCSITRCLSDKTDCSSLLEPGVLPVITWRRRYLESPLLAAKLVYFWWRVWKSRNKVVFEATQFTLDSMHRQFQLQWSEAMQFFNRPNRLPSQPMSSIMQQARRPFQQPNWVIHVDAAVRPSLFDHGYGAIGLVVHRSCGSLVSATGLVYEHCDDPFILEFLAIRQALYVAKFWTRINSDCLEAVRLITSSAEDVRVGQLLPECRILYNSLPTLRLLHVHRSGNCAAHTVAREALSYPNTSHFLSLQYCISHSF
ncbi:hypothetical protein LINGRAHAP2_LOCUS24405 [Linum grandiflorum]